MKNYPTSGKPHHPQAVVKSTISEDMHLLREVLKQIATFPTDGDFGEWEKLWEKKAQINARLNPYNN